jgi:RHS repeat-associated protein
VRVTSIAVLWSGRRIAGRSARWTRLATVSGLVAALASPSGSDIAAAAPSDAIRYVYDEGSRLRAVTDPAGDTAIYEWDAVGNLLSIDRFDSDDVSIAQLTPARGPVGSAVTIFGTGFSATPAQNDVEVNGSQATVTSASATALQVTVPAGATTGPVTVTTPAGSATSDRDFVVAGADGPTVTDVQPRVAATGSTVTVTGTGFGPDPAPSPRINQTFAEITSPGATSLGLRVPGMTASGRVRIATPEGAATGPDLFVPPAGYTVSDVQVTDRMSPGDTKAVSITSGGKVALVAFDAKGGDRVALKVSGFPSAASIVIVKPDGGFLYQTTSSNSSGVFVDTQTLPRTGTYTIMVDAQGTATGTATLKLHAVPADHTAAIQPTAQGDPEQVPLPSVGQNGRLTFTGQAGQAIAVRPTGWGGSFWGYLSVRKADGTQIGSRLEIFCTASSCFDAFLDQRVLPSSGQYEVFVDSISDGTGSVAVTTYDASDHVENVVPTSAGSVSAVALTPGRNARLRFEGMAGQRIAMSASAWSSAGATMSILKPDGTTLAGSSTSVSTSGAFKDPLTLPANGTYTMLFDPQVASSGSVTLKLYDVPTDQSIPVVPTTAGDAEALTFAAPGQAARLTFSGQAGQGISVRGTSLGSGFTGTLSVVKADGTQIGQNTTICSGCGDNFLDQRVLPANGDYAVLVDPSGDKTGTLTVTTYDASDHVETVVPTAQGVATALSLTTPGRNASLKFAGAAGQRIAWKWTGWSPSAALWLAAPNGSEISGTYTTVNSTGGFMEPKTLAATGTHTLRFDPQAISTGSQTLTLYDVPADQSVAITPSGAGDAEALTFSAPGQNARLTFTGQAGQAISAQGSSFGGGFAGKLSVIKADGTPVGQSVDACASTCGQSFVDQRVLPANGNYAVLVDPTKDSTGSLTVATYDASNVTDDIEIGGPSVQVPIVTPGQNGRVTFSGSSGANVQLTISSVTAASRISIVKPDGSDLVTNQAVTTAGAVINRTLPATGTYTIVDDPVDATVGSMTLTLSQLAAAMPAPPTLIFASLAGPAGLLPRAEQPTSARPPRKSPTAERQHPVADRGAARAPRRPTRQAPERRPRKQLRRPAGETPFGHLPTARGPERWIPGAVARRDGWTTERPDLQWTSIAQRQAPTPQTAVTGQVLKLNGLPLPGVFVGLEDAGEPVRTDRAGRFLIADVPAGRHVLVVGDHPPGVPGRYGTFEIAVDLKRGQTTPLDFSIWLPLLDPAGDRRVESPTQGETVLTTPRIPGLEVHIPAGSQIRDRHGRPVRELNMTAIPIDRPPFPLPPYTEVPTYFTVQPGGADLSKGAKIVYPNYNGLAPGQRVDFWSYDPDDRGWHVYGKGTVTPDGKQVVPDRDVRIWELSGAMFSTGAPAPGVGSVGAGFGGAGGGTGGDPVDLASGLFVYEKTDLSLPDFVPASVTRTYRPGDDNFYAFGRGMTNLFDLRLRATAQMFQAVDLVLPSGRQVRYVRISPGTGGQDAVFEAQASPGLFHKSRIAWSPQGWLLRIRDGSVYRFPEFGPLVGIRDRFGHELTIERSFTRVTQVTTTNGRWIKFNYNGSGRVTSVQDNAGRTVSYTYDAGDRLETVTDPKGGVTTYGYDANGRMASIEDARGITFLTNEYDGGGRVIRQEMPDGGSYEFDYTLDNGEITAATLTDERGNERIVDFDGDGYVVSDTFAAGTADEQAYTYDRDPTSHQLLSVTDPLGRKTELGYDGEAKVTSITELADTQDARTTALAYAPGSERLTSITDALQHTTTLAYDQSGRLTSVEDASGREITYGYSGNAVRPATFTNAAGKTWEIDYVGADVASVTDPLGKETSYYVDAAGRLSSLTDPLGNRTVAAYDALSQVVKLVEPGGRTTLIDRDANGNVLEVTDARDNTIGATYDSMDRLATRTDGLSRSESFDYDDAGNLVRHTDRRGKDTVFGYDALNRSVFAGFDATGDPEQYDSTIELSYDDGNRLVEADDSAAGTFARAYDDLDRMTSETGPHGTVGYAYDDADRRTSMTVPGQSAVGYAYDDANRLTDVTRGAAAVDIAYDTAGRRSSLTLPNGIVQEYSYDDASRLSGIAYKQGGATIGQLSYEYDAAGRRTAVWGSSARTGIPQAMASATYDDANQRVSQGATTLTYDANGNLTDDGTATYAWDARNQLESVTRGQTLTTFDYDPFGRRQSKATGSTTTDFLYDGWNVTQAQQGGSATANVLGGLRLDEVYSRTTTAGTDNYLTDALGSTTALTGPLGWPASTTYTYDPFGNTTSSGTTSDNPYQYTGRENDGDGLYHYRARYYSPVQQRFLSEDPLGVGGGDVNLYAYVAGNPITNTDALGLSSLLTDLATSVTGTFDGLTFNLTAELRNTMGIGYGGIDPCSGVYSMASGIASGTVIIVASAGGGSAATATALSRGAHWFGAGITGGVYGGLMESYLSGGGYPGAAAAGAFGGASGGWVAGPVGGVVGEAVGIAAGTGASIAMGNSPFTGRGKEGCG